MSQTLTMVPEYQLNRVPTYNLRMGKAEAALTASGLSKPNAATPNASNMQKVEAAAEDFEAVFLSQMLEHMFAGVEPNDVFGGGHAEEVYQSLLVDEYGKIIAQSGGIGVADHVKREILRLQESQ